MKSYKATIVISAISILTAAGAGFGQEVNMPEGALQKLKDAFKFKDKEERKPFMYSFNMPFGNQSRDVLVIPASEMGAEKIGEITEDMAVMSSILEKQLYEENEQGQMFFHGASWFGRGSLSIFIEGYGALFLMKADFPLLPMPEEPAEEVKKEDADQTWEQAKRELHSPGMTNVVIPHPKQFGKEMPKYDKEKVESLKSNLIKTLKYASNIRALKSDEFAVAVVTSAGQNRGGPVTQSVMVSTGGKTLVNQSGQAEAQGSSPGVLTIRAKKSDIDAYSKGEISLEQFSQKVNVLIY
jgi:hypothetical protein